LTQKNSKIIKKALIDLLIQRKNISCRKTAEAIILSGEVLVDGIVIDKPKTLINIDSEIVIKEKNLYVSRGAIKLAQAVEDFKIDIKGKNCIDFGASSGGFTDFMLKNGASKIIAIDVGYGQFDWKLRNNKNIFLFERTNIKNIKPEELPFLADFAVADLSFISIRNIFIKIYNLTNSNANFLLLIKPQFELEKDLVENKGVIKDINLHIKVLNDVINYFNEFEGVDILGLNFSKIKGAKGNIEYWIYLKKINNTIKEKNINYDKIVKDIALKSHEFFK